MWRRTVDCLGVAVAIESDVDQAELLSSVFRSYAETSALPALTYRLFVAEWPTLERDGRVIQRCDTTLDLVAALELDLYNRVAAVAHGLVLHAGCVCGPDGKAIVLAGESGAGKSTLVRALLARHYRYVSEECVAVDEAARCIGLARALQAEEDIDLPPTFRRDPYTMAGPNGIRQTLLIHPPEGIMWRHHASIAAVVCISHAPDACDELTPLSSGEMLVRLWPTMLRRSVDESVQGCKTLAGVECHALETRTSNRALALVTALCKRLGIHGG